MKFNKTVLAVYLYNLYVSGFNDFDLSVCLLQTGTG